MARNFISFLRFQLTCNTKSTVDHYFETYWYGPR